MHIKKETDLNNLIKSSGINGIYLLCGTEDFLVNNWKNVLIKDYRDDTFNFVRLDGTILDLNEMYDAAQQLSMFGGGRLVLMENVDIKKLNKDGMDSLLQIFENNPENTIILLTLINTDLKLAAAKKLISLVDKHGLVVEFGPRDSASLGRHVKSILKENGAEISTVDAGYIVRLCGGDMQKLSLETEKLAAYAKNRTVTTEDVNLIIIPTVEEKVFDLSKVILAGNISRALEITNTLIASKESPVMIVSTLIMSYVDLYRGKIGQKSGVYADELGKKLNYRGLQFRLKNAYGTKISLGAVQRSLNLLYDTDKKLKSSAVEDNLLLEKTVLELLYLRES